MGSMSDEHAQQRVESERYMIAHNERLKREKEQIIITTVDAAYDRGVFEGLKVAREIAGWMLGQENVSAIKQIETHRKRLLSKEVTDGVCESGQTICTDGNPKSIDEIVSASYCVADTSPHGTNTTKSAQDVEQPRRGTSL